ncbi:MAG: energy-coupling factor transport system permease protein [Chloroflexota bacterium]|jgi:energy-coupling factor transport system substrate-specific component|nr:energy-coupling factor transport system permease protein [Chloroflexota bacterium]
MSIMGGTSTAWRTRDIVVVAVIAVAFGVFFWAFGLAWSGLAVLGPLQNVFYAGWLLPAIVAPLIVRKPGAALFAELVAAGVSMLIGSQWSVDTLVSGLVQGAAAELVFAAFRYRNWSLPAIALASLASVAAAFVHDWLVYYATYDAGALAVLAGFMALSGLIVLPLVAVAIVSALRQTGVLEGFPA